MIQSWDSQIEPYTSFYYQSQRARLEFAIQVLEDKALDFQSLRKQHSHFLHLLKQSYENVENVHLIVKFMELLHGLFYTQQADWNEWIWHLNQAMKICSEQKLDKVQARIGYFLASVLHLSGNLELAKQYGNDALMQAKTQKDANLVAAIGSTLIGIAISQSVDTATVMQMIESIEAYPNEIEADDSSKATSNLRMSLARIRLLRLQGRLMEALKVAQDAIHWSNVIKSDALLSKAEAQIQAQRLCGLVFWALGQNLNAVKNFSKAIQIARKKGYVFLEAWTHGNLGLLQWHNGNLFEAEDEIHASISILEKLNANQQIVAQFGNLGLVLLFQGRLDEAFELIEKQRSLADYFGLESEYYRATGNRGVIKFHLGQFQAALEDLEEDTKFTGQWGLHEGVINNYINMARCYYALNDEQNASDYLNRALKACEKLQSSSIKLIALRVLAETQEGAAQNQSLREALSLARLRQFDRAAILLGLAHHYGASRQGKNYSNKGQKLLLKCGGSEWLKNYTDGKTLYLPTLT